MNIRQVAVCCALTLAITGFVRADSNAGSLSSAERAKIERLIAVVENLNEARFVRNGWAYGPATAGKFLRAKWKDRESSVHSADGFIQNVATRSSTTGRPYLIRFNSGRELPLADFLRSELAKLK